MMTSSSALPTILLASATGARSMAGVAATARGIASRADQSTAQPARFLASPGVAATLSALAAMELVADKLPFIPNRTDPAPLIGRIVAGGLIGAAIAAVAGRDRAQGTLIGAVAAFAGAHAGFQLRHALTQVLPAPVAGLVEDAAVGALAAAGISAMSGVERYGAHLTTGSAPAARLFN